MAIRRSFAKPREWAAWSGDLEDLRRIGRAVESLYREHPSNIEDQSSSSQGSHMDFRTGPINITGETTINYIAVPSGDEIEYYPFLGMILVDDERISGDIDEVLAELDRRSTKKFVFIGAIGPRDKVVVSFERDASSPIALSVESPNPGWARQALASLSSEIEKGVPKWAFVHEGKLAASVAKAATTAALVAAIVLAIVGNLNTERAGGLAFLSTIAALPLVTSNRVTQWLFPSLEILGDGVQSTGSRRVVLVLGLLISIPIGVLVNRIS